jgi:hypothetical protein
MAEDYGVAQGETTPTVSRSCRSARVNDDDRVPPRPAIGNAPVKLRTVRRSLHD